jgi:hypothetical protein
VSLINVTDSFVDSCLMQNVPDGLTLGPEDSFCEEMKKRSYGDWALSHASIIHDSLAEQLPHVSTRYAVAIAKSLQHARPGLVTRSGSGEELGRRSQSPICAVEADYSW